MPQGNAAKTGDIEWPEAVATRLAGALADIRSIAASAGETNPAAAIAAIHTVVEEMSAFDPDRMRLRFDDQHGNRSFVQRVDGIWKAFRSDGREVRFSYCFGSLCDDAAILAGLAAATTIDGVQRVAMDHLRDLKDVQVEAVWERHSQVDGRFEHVPLP